MSAQTGRAPPPRWRRARHRWPAPSRASEGPRLQARAARGALCGGGCPTSLDARSALPRRRREGAGGSAAQHATAAPPGLSRRPKPSRPSSTRGAAGAGPPPSPPMRAAGATEHIACASSMGPSAAWRPSRALQGLIAGSASRKSSPRRAHHTDAARRRGLHRHTGGPRAQCRAPQM